VTEGVFLRRTKLATASNINQEMLHTAQNETVKTLLTLTEFPAVKKICWGFVARFIVAKLQMQANPDETS